MIIHGRFTIPPFPIAFCAVGFALMLGVILYSEDINQLLPTEPVIAEATPVKASPIAAATVSPPIAVATDDENIATIINDPRNYRVVPKDIMPGQAILEGKTTKFLLGF